MTRTPADDRRGPGERGDRRSARTRSAYDGAALRYHEKFSCYPPYRERVSSFAAKLRPGGEVLDLGCGSGANARLLVDAGLRVQGYDYSPAMLELARRECPEGVFAIADLRRLREERQFDAVVASFCVVHFDHAEARCFLQGLPKLMRPDALLYLSFMEGGRNGWSTSSFSEEPLFYNHFDREWIVEQLFAAGLRLVCVATHDYPERDGSTTTDVFLELRKGSDRSADR